MIDKIKPTIAIGAEVRLIFSETESIECAWIFFGDLNGYEILIAQPVDNQDFCRKSAHWRPRISFTFYPASSTGRDCFRYDGESEEETRSVETTLFCSALAMGSRSSRMPTSGSVTKSLNRPEWERLSCLNARISVIEKVNLTVVARARKRFAFSES